MGLCEKIRKVATIGVLVALSVLGASAKASLFTWDFDGDNGNLGKTTTFGPVGSVLTATGYRGTSSSLDSSSGWVKKKKLKRRNDALGVRGGGNNGQINANEAILFDFGGPGWSLVELDFEKFKKPKRNGEIRDSYSVYVGDEISPILGNGIFDDFDGLTQLAASFSDDPFETNTPTRYVLVVGETGKFRIGSVSGTASEPATVALFGFGLLAAGWATRRRSRWV